MGRRKKYKVGDRVFFEFYDGTIGSAIVKEIKPDIYTEYNNTLSYSDPRVKELQKQLAKQDSLAQDIRDWIALRTGNYPGYYDNETIAAALGQVAKEYGYNED